MNNAGKIPRQIAIGNCGHSAFKIPGEFGGGAIVEFVS